MKKKQISKRKSSASQNPLLRLFQILKDGTGLDFLHYKNSTIQRRIQRRMKLLKLDNLKAYINYVDENNEEKSALCKDILINVTSFFRDPKSFEALKKTYFPVLFKKRSPHLPLRIWVPACSTGEEAYSIAIALVESMRATSRSIPVQIFATDVGEASLAKARAGRYPLDISKHVSPERLKKFFIKSPQAYQVNKQIRDMCIFARQNVTCDPPLSKMDLISCRNLLIYLEVSMQKKILSVFHYALNPHGYLALGTSESVGSSGALFQLLDKKNKIYAKKTVALPLLPDLVLEPPSAGKAELAKAVPGMRFSQDLQREAELLILSKHAPASVIIDEEATILHFRGPTSLFLEHPSGHASLNLLKMAHESLSLELKVALREVQKKQVSIRKNGISIRISNQRRKVNFEILPLKSISDASHYLVVLEESSWLAPAARQAGKEKAGRGGKEEGLAVQDLKRELVATREYLQSLSEEHESVIEELRAANEETLSSNEELQSTNEELETAKEELQAANEELISLNEELQRGNRALKKGLAERLRAEAKLRQSEEKFRLLVEGVKDYSIFMLDPQGQIASWNAGAQRIQGYAADEIIGKHFSIFYPQEDKDAKKPERELVIAADEGKYQEEGWRVRKDGSRYWADVLITALWDEQGKIRGFGKVTRDMTERKIADEKLKAAHLSLEQRVLERTADLERANEELRKASQIKSSFVSMVSHELRTPLSSMKVGIDFLLEGLDGPLTEAQKETLNIVQRNIDRLSRLIDNVLDYSRLEAGKMKMVFERVDLKDLVSETCSAMKLDMVAKQIRFAQSLPKQPLHAVCDADKIKQVLINLLNNAIKFTEEGGSIDLRLSATEDEVELSVKDDGIGISPEDNKKIFEMFGQAMPRGIWKTGGSGIGLAVCKRILDEHQGRISVESAPGLGARFRVNFSRHLPLSPSNDLKASSEDRAS